MTDQDPANEFLDLTDVSEGYVAHSDDGGFEYNSGSGPGGPVPGPEPGPEPSPPPEPPPESLTDQDGIGSCRVCGAPTFRPPGLSPTGRKKRTPKYCDLHARNIPGQKRRPDAETVGDKRPSPETELRNTQQSLADNIKLIAVFLVPLGYPVTSVYVADAADPAVMALVAMFRNSPQMMRILHHAGQLAPAYRLLEAIAGTGVSVQVDKQRHDPYSSVSRHLRVTQAYESVYGQHSQAGPQTAGNGMGPTMAGAPPPRFAGVGG